MNSCEAAKILQIFCNRVIRVPFVDGGRDWNGLDCFGLARLCYSECLGIDLPSYGDISAQDMMRIALKIEEDAASQIWVAAPAPQEFDFVVMKWFAKRHIGHVGIVLDKRHILHTEAHTGPVIVPIDHFSIKTRIAYYRRHWSMANEFA